MGLKLTCPHCGQRMTMDFATSKVYCQHCGYVRPDEIATLEDQIHLAKSQAVRPAVQMIHRGEIAASARAAFDTGQDELAKSNKPAAMTAFLRSLDDQPDFLDGHLWVARLSDDPAVKRDHLDSILALVPNQIDAIREKMVLDGKLTPEQAARTTTDHDIMIRRIDGVAAKSTDLICPTCGGQLTVDEVAHRVVCRFCGFTAPRTVARMHGSESLTAALLQRKAELVHWNVGKRIVKCQQCGAEHTLPAEKMSQRCRFCGSTHVVLSDALGTFAQPDGIVPFGMSQQAAQEKVDQELHSLGERFAGLFRDQRIERSTVEGVYLPFWAFDVMFDITRTETQGLSNTETHLSDGVMDVAVHAVKSPPPALITHIERYDLSEVVLYEPHFLAKYPAQIYSIEFDNASLDAREIASKIVKARYEPLARSESKDYHTSRHDMPIKVSYMPMVQTMSFQLMLLPVWIATLTEADGDTRIALVNGQTGQTVLGRSVG